MVRTALILIWIPAVLILAGPFLLLYAALSRDSHPMYVTARFTIRAAFWISGIRIDVEGDTAALRSRNFIFMANHVSNIDPPVCFACIPHDIKVIFKKELLKLPILSTALSLARCIPVDRADSDAARAAIDRAIEQAKGGDSFLIYPEGTRSRDGTLGEFKGGGFVLAIISQVPVVPITLIGTREIQPKGQRRLKSGCVRIVFHPAVAPPPQAEDKDSFREAVRQAIDSRLMKGAPPPPS